MLSTVCFGNTEWMQDLSTPRDSDGEELYFFALTKPYSLCGCFPSICLEWNGTFYTGKTLQNRGNSYSEET